MLICRPRLATRSCLRNSPARFASASPAATSKPQPSDTAPGSPWDHVFSDIEPVPSPSQRLLTRSHRSGCGSSAAATTSSLSDRHKKRDTPSNLVERSSSVRHRRASMTAREMSVFDEMFDMIFNAVSAQDKGKAPSVPSSGSTGTTTTTMPPSIGHAGPPLNDLFRTLRRHTSRTRWTTAIDEELDRKKETMELFNTDYDLLQWVTQELFGEARQWDEEAKRVMAADGGGGGTAATQRSKDGPGRHSIYPHLIAHAMRVFRTTYSNPTLSLAVFNHAARVSIPSYVFGCTAPAYNELIEAKWEGWGDLEGVCGALEEMKANGVKTDGRTRIVVEKVRRQVSEARLVADVGEDDGADRTKDVNPLARRLWEELGDAEVTRLVHRIERLALRERSRKSAPSPHEESWKSAALQPGEDDGWRFDSWEEKRPRDRDNRRRKSEGNRSGTELRSPEKEMALR